MESRSVFTETSPPILKDVGVRPGSVRLKSIGTQTSTVKKKDAVTEPQAVIMVSVGVSKNQPLNRSVRVQVCPFTRSTGK